MSTFIPGEFVPLDTQYYLDERVQRAGSAAEVLYTRSLAFAKGADSDGIVSRYGLLAFSFGLRNVAQRTQKLVDTGLWVEVDEGWKIAGWEKWNKSKAQINAEKEARKASAISANHVRWHVSSGKKDPKCEHCQVSESDPNQIQESESESDTESESESESQLLHIGGAKAPTAKKRGTRLNREWVPTREAVQTIAEDCPNFDTQREHKNFVDYWLAQPGAKGVKLDWDATWRNWMRRAHTDQQTGYQNTAQRMEQIRATAAAATQAAQGNAMNLIEGKYQ